jgi:nucleoside-diphosphate-sugar epimerase
MDQDWSTPLAQCAALVHLAAVGVNPQGAGREELFEVNVRQSTRLWECAVAAGIKRLVICGSCFEYGTSGERYESIPVDAPLEPANPYAESKVAATQVALEMGRAKRLELIVLRPFHVFGEGEAATRFWPGLRRAAACGEDFPMTPGEQVRDFTPVNVVAEAFVAALTRTDLTAGEPIIENVGTGVPTRLLEFARHWWETWQATGRLLPGAVPYRDGEVMRYVPQLPGRAAS